MLLVLSNLEQDFLVSLLPICILTDEPVIVVIATALVLVAVVVVVPLCGQGSSVSALQSLILDIKDISCLTLCFGANLEGGEREK